MRRIMIAMELISSIMIISAGSIVGYQKSYTSCIGRTIHDCALCVRVSG